MQSSSVTIPLKIVSQVESRTYSKEDLQVAKKILEMVPHATVGFKDGFCISLDLCDEDKCIYGGLIRQHASKADVLHLVARLPYLRFLNLRKNYITHMPHLSHLRDLEYLDISCNDLDIVPMWVMLLKNLKYLDVSYNGLWDLPERLADLSALETFKAEHNNLPVLPDSFIYFDLKSLHLFNNRFDWFPKPIMGYGKLKEFTWGVSKVQTIPDWLASQPDMRKLKLACNRISGIPKFMERCTSLRSLNLAKNNISEIPPFVGEWKKLKEASFYGNNISKFPESFYGLKLSKLNVENNPLDGESKFRLKADVLMT